MVLLKILFLPILFIIFAFGEIARVPLPNSVTFGLIDFSILSIIFFWLIFVKKTKYVLAKPIFFFLAICLFSLSININRFESEQLLISSLYLVRFAFYALLYFVFVDIGKKLNWQIQKYITVSGLLIIIFGFFQYFFYPNLRNLYYLGWDEHMYRLFSSFFDPNFAGVILILFFIFFFIKRNEIFKERKISYFVLAANFIAIILTYSRGALLMLAVSTLSYSVIKREWKLVAGLGMSFVLIFSVLSPRFYIENTNLLRFASVEARLQSTQEAIKIWRENPLGVGFNTYRYAREKYGDVDKSEFGPSHAGAGVDNSFIFVLVTTGIAGIITYLFLLYKISVLGFSKINNKYGLILVVSLFGLISNSLFISSLFYSFVMIWVWILAGLTESN